MDDHRQMKMDYTALWGKRMSALLLMSQSPSPYLQWLQSIDPQMHNLISESDLLIINFC